MRCRSLAVALGGLLLLAASLVAAGPLDPPGPIIEPPQPPVILFPNVAVQAPALTPSPVVRGAEGYTARVLLRSTGTLTATKVRLRVDLRQAGVAHQTSEVFLGDMPAGTEQTVALPGHFEIPLTGDFELVATASAEGEVNTSDNVAVGTPEIRPLPSVLLWAGFRVLVKTLDKASTLDSMTGTGRLVIPGTPPVRIPVAFAHVKADTPLGDESTVLSADPLALTLAPPVAVTGANGTSLRLAKLSLPASGPLTADGEILLPAGAGVDTVNGVPNRFPFGGKVLRPDMVLQKVDFINIVLRDRPLRLLPTAPVDLSLDGTELFPLSGKAVGRPSWDMTLDPTYTPEVRASRNASNDGMLVGDGNSTPPVFELSGVMRPTGMDATLKATATVGYRSLFPRAQVALRSLALGYAGGVVNTLQGRAAVKYTMASSLPVDPHLIPTSRTLVQAVGDVSQTDTSGGFAGRPTMDSPSDGVYAWVAPPANTDRKVFFATDRSPILFMLGGHTPTLPHSYFISRLKVASDGKLETAPRFVGSAVAPLDPGVNLVTDVTSKQSEQTVTMNLLGSGGPIKLTGPKLNVYLRAGGVSGVWGSETDAASPAKTEMYGKPQPGDPDTGAWGENRGFPTEFTNVSLGFLDTEVQKSNLAGNITVRPPMGTGSDGLASNKYAFAGMTVTNDGQLGEANVPPSGASIQELAFWKTLERPKGVFFQAVDDYLATHKTFLGVNAELSFPDAPAPGSKYVRDPFAVDGLLFSGPGHPHPTRSGTPHLAMGNRWMGFDFHPEAVRLSDPLEKGTVPAPGEPPATPIPWESDASDAAKAALQPRPGTTGGSPAVPTPGWVQLNGTLKLPFFGDTKASTYIDVREDYVTLSKPLTPETRELFDAMPIGGTYAFSRAATDKDGRPRPNTFLGGFEWKLPLDLLKADGSVQLFDREEGGNRARLFLGAEANMALLDTAAGYADKLALVADKDKLYAKLGMAGDYDKSKAKALVDKVGQAYSAIGGWASPKPGGSTTDLTQVHSLMGQLYEDAKEGTGYLSDLADPVNQLVQQSTGVLNTLKNLPVQVRYLRGTVELQDDEWEQIEAEAGLWVKQLVQDGSVKFRMNRHNEYWLELAADKLSLPFTDLANAGNNSSTDRKKGLAINDPYLRLYLKPADFRLDGSMGSGQFNLMAILDPAKFADGSTPSPLVVTSLDASMGIGVGLAYFGAAVGLKGDLIAKFAPVDSVSAGLLAGYGIDSAAIDLTGVLKPDVKAALLEGLAASGAPSMSGLMVEAGFGKSLVNLGCFFNAGFSVDAGLWAFLVTAPSANAILGGRFYGEAHGEAICLVDVKGELTLLGQYTTANNNLKVVGSGRVKGSVDLWLDEISVSAGVEVTAQTNPSSFDVDVDL